MSKAGRRFAIVGNWKMNPDTREEALDLFSAAGRAAKKARKTQVIVAPPAPFIRELAAKESPVEISAQDVAAEASGSFTGSVSARELRSAGAAYAIIGHSERRKAGDTDEIVALKVHQAVEAGLRPIVCVGESERDAHAHYLKTVRDQVVSIMAKLDPKKARALIIAYEPVWAIGKSYDAALKPSDIHEMTLYIKKIAAESLGKKDGLKMQVLYGGSVNLENAKHILRDASADGLLIGRQSLDRQAFSEIIEYADSL